MNNLHRDLAPISDGAWDQIEDEARRTFSTRSAARRVVDMPEPAGFGLSAVGTGHVASAQAPADGVIAHTREVQPVVEYRVPFTVSRQAVDDVDRGAEDSDWDAVKDAAAKLALAEDRTVFHGAAGIEGIGPSSSNARIALPDDVLDVPGAVARAISELRRAGVSGSYSLLLSDELYTRVAETTDHGYPIRDHVARIMGEDGHIVWAPALDGALIVSERGGDYVLRLGQDVSIGYLSHDDSVINLYLQESFTFQVNTAEASVVIGN